MLVACMGGEHGFEPVRVVLASYAIKRWTLSEPTETWEIAWQEAHPAYL